MNYSNSFSETELFSSNALYNNSSTNSHSTMNYNASNNTMIGLEGLNNNTNTSSPSESNLSEKDRQIFNNNNLRLAQLEKDIRVFTHYGGACDELMNWLIDDRAYSSMNEEALLKCLTAIFEKYIEHGRWSGIQILKTANERCASLSENAQALIKRYYHEACNTSQVRRLSEGSVTSNSSNLTMTGSPTSTRSIPNTSTPQSPITSNFLQNTQLTNLVKNILDGSTSPQPQQQTFPIQPAPPQYQIPLNPQASLQRHLMQQQYNNRQQHQQQQQVLQRNQQIQVQQQQQQQQHQQQYQQQQYQQQPPQQQQQQQQQQQSPLQIHQYKHIQQQRITQQQQQFLQQRQAHLLHQQKVQQQVQMQAQQKAQNTPSGQQRLTQHFFVQNQRPPTTMPPSPAATTTTTATTTNYLPQWNAELQHQVMRILNGEQMATLPNQPAIPATTNTQAYNGTPNTPAVNVPMYANQPTTPKVVNPPVYNGTPNNGPMVLPAQPTAPTLASGFVGTNQPVGSPQPSVSPATSPIRPIAPNPVPKAVTTPVSHPRQLHLPNLGPQVKKSKTLDKEKDRARFRFTKEYAIKPFRLVHDQPITGKMFYIPRPEFDLLCLNEDTLIDENDAFPMAFVFTSWYQDGAERKCDWPQSLRVELNGRPLPLQKKTKNTNNTGPPYVGKDYPFELTKQLRAGENSLRIHQVGCACSYYFCVQIFKRFSINAAKRMIEKATVSVTDTERMIRNYLGSMEDGDDDEIVILQRSIKLSLKCPISLKKIKIPTRGKHCKHLDCFDLVPYLLINENKTPQWACPCCSKTAYPDDLVRDLLIESLLKKLPKNVTEIEFETDEKNYKITKVDDQDSEDELVDDSDDDQSIKDKSSVEPVKKEEYAVAEIPNNATVIDLISDDEEEEETTPQQQFKRRRDD